MTNMYGNHINLSQIFSSNLIKIDPWLIPRGSASPHDTRQMQEVVAKWIDHLGQGSTVAQGLNTQLTTAEKFTKTSDQEIYAYISKQANNGTGQMIGLLRTGRKNLYFHSESGRVIHRHADCILDFYVTEEYQRHGIGKLLYDFMLKDKNVEPHMLPVDKPSPKMLAFLKKNYGLTDLSLHNNNYAVVPAFFGENETGSKSNGVGQTRPQPSQPVGRFAAHRPRSQIESVLYGDHS